MKVETTAAQLSAALSTLKGIVHRYGTTPVLSGVKFHDGKITGTDLDTEATVTLPTIGKQDGALAVDYFALAAVAGHIDRGETVTIADAEGVASLAFNGSDYRMPSYAASDFPVFPKVEGEVSAIDNVGLVAAFRRVRFAMSQEETRYYLNGIGILKDADGALIAAATDGHRLAIMPVAGAPESAVGAIIPRHLVHYLCRQKGEPHTAIFQAAPPRARFDFAGLTVSAKMIDGKFPDIFRVIPQDVKRIFSLDRMTLLKVLMRMRAFNDRRFAGVGLEAEACVLTLTMKGSEDKQAVERVQLPDDVSEPWSAGFNADYLIDALSAMQGDIFTVESAPTQLGGPSIFTSQDDPLRIILMPRRV